ncbi:unnamed protein product [Gongylonema pulchrum]|uniref:Neur_chan_memb domain-containing protein n=1 Tax=Gongylonema pulchrum TaxID=637853 RepID=A0A183DNB5_9BILA|nr:unnamed protein product [Gongylonema pulchrum]
MKRYRSYTGSGGATTTMCYYEMAENSPMVRRTRPARRKRCSIVSEIENDYEQEIPLLARNAGNKLRVKPVVITTTSNEYVPICLRIRPSQVDLISRIAFPTFFIVFHIVYWTVYLYL